MKCQELLKNLDADALADAFLMYDVIYRETMYNDTLPESDKNEKNRKYRTVIRKTVEEFRNVIVKEGTEMMLFCHNPENSNDDDLCGGNNTFPMEQTF